MVTPQPPIEVEVFGQRFALRSEKSAEDVRQIAAYVDHQLQQVAAQARTPVQLRVAIMAALTIADEYHTATGRLEVPRAVELGTGRSRTAERRRGPSDE
jgi:cell division protein ZapA (FtsZ GTPase activity inhibitor)